MAKGMVFWHAFNEKSFTFLLYFTATLFYGLVYKSRYRSASMLIDLIAVDGDDQTRGEC